VSWSWCLRFVRDRVVCLTLCFSLFEWSTRNWGFSQFCFRIAALWVKTPSWLAGDLAFGRNMLSQLSRYSSEDEGSMSLWNVDLHLPGHTLNVRRPENLISELPHTQYTWRLAWIALACFAQQTFQLCIIIVTSRWKRFHDNYQCDYHGPDNQGFIPDISAPIHNRTGSGAHSASRVFFWGEIDWCTFNLSRR